MSYTDVQLGTARKMHGLFGRHLAETSLRGIKWPEHLIKETLDEVEGIKHNAVAVQPEPQMPATQVEEETSLVVPPPATAAVQTAVAEPLPTKMKGQHAQWLLDAAARIKAEREASEESAQKFVEERMKKGRGMAWIPDDERKYKLWRAPFVHSPEFREHPEEYGLVAQRMDQKQNERFTALVEAHLAKRGKLPRNVTRWSDAPPPAASFVRPLTKADVEDVLDVIPAFDPSVMSGIYKKFVDVVTAGTTMSPQFVYAIAKTIVGARMAGKVKFEHLDVEPRFYTALIGESGSGKGESWRRVLQVLNCGGQIVGSVAGLKIINSADSGAGIKDAFFEPPEDAPVLMYVDEIEGFGNKAAATRNPAILDTLIELADSTSISRVKAARKGVKANKTKNDARLCAVLCGQDGHVYLKALAGRTKLGLWDRLTPEYGVAVEAGDLPPISTQDAFQLLQEFVKLDYSGTMTMAPGVKTALDEFWQGQPSSVKKKARWKKSLTLDVYMSAFGRGLKVAELEDVENAIKTFTRQLVIRQIHFTTEVPDRTGYYLSLIKTITEKMERQIKAGVAPKLVAKSRRDYEKETYAYRDNESHLFGRAWDSYAPTHLARFDVKKANGQTYIKYVPVIDDEGSE
jgi:hypothetical protein